MPPDAEPVVSGGIAAGSRTLETGRGVAATAPKVSRDGSYGSERISEGLPQEIGYNAWLWTVAPPGGPGPTPGRDGTGLDSAASLLYFMDP